jgi:hypothetical protein
VWQAMEDYVAMYVAANLPPALQLIEIPEEQRDPERPTRFQFVLLNAPETRQTRGRRPERRPRASLASAL